MESDQSTLIHTISRSAREELRLTRREYKGKQYFDLRLFFIPKDESDFKPCRKGICLAMDLLDELIHGLQLLRQRHKEID